MGVTRMVATLLVALLAVASTPVSGVAMTAGPHDCCDSRMAMVPCERTIQALPCCGTPVPAPSAVAAGQVTVAAPRVTPSWGLGAERPPDSAAPVEAAAAYVRWLARTPPPPYLLHRVLRI
jgi:hypothetical protein